MANLNYAIVYKRVMVYTYISLLLFALITEIALVNFVAREILKKLNTTYLPRIRKESLRESFGQRMIF